MKANKYIHETMIYTWLIFSVQNKIHSCSKSLYFVKYTDEMQNKKTVSVYKKVNIIVGRPSIRQFLGHVISDYYNQYSYWLE